MAVEREVNCQLGRAVQKQEDVPITDRPYNDQRYLIDTRKATEELRFSKDRGSTNFRRDYSCNPSYDFIVPSRMQLLESDNAI